MNIINNNEYNVVMICLIITHVTAIITVMPYVLTCHHLEVKYVSIKIYIIKQIRLLYHSYSNHYAQSQQLNACLQS